jgi:NAD(P)-dependent dehydrogenase (short-subunit alcohol dehydrogenase family)
MSHDTNPVVVVTGSNRGIGFETVRALVTADRLYTVILCSRDVQKGQDAAATLEKEAKQGSRVVPLQLDIEDDNSIDHFVKEVKDMFGRVDILINNIGPFYFTFGIYHTSSSHRRRIRQLDL